MDPKEKLELRKTVLEILLELEFPKYEKGVTCKADYLKVLIKRCQEEKENGSLPNSNLD